jgi:hypothetical protein
MTILDDLTLIKSTYRQIFQAASAQIQETVEALHAQTNCTTAGCACANNPNLAADITHPLPSTCGYRDWQQSGLDFLEQDLAKQIVTRLQHIKVERDRVDCHSCGVCCRLASSEFSYEQLLAKANDGDWFAQQFTSVFLPYDSPEAARAAFPKLVSQVIDYGIASPAPGSPSPVAAPSTPAIYFYHCPHIGDDNRCTIYGTPQRPQICASYPETPLTFIYDKCAWRGWKDANHVDALTAHATIELIGFLSGQIRQALAKSSDY